MTITLIAGFRDRDLGRVKRSLDSLTIQSCKDFSMVLIDYGSSLERSDQTRKLLQNYPFCKYIYSDTRGWLWNRSAALNSGARLATSEYLLFTDVDIVYDVDFIQRLYDGIQEDVFLISDCVRVPKGFDDWDNVIIGKYKGPFNSMKGKGIACYPKRAFETIGGFDEKYSYWGREDLDIALRMKRLGLREIIDRELYTYHQWHPKANTSMPYPIVFNNVCQYYACIRENRIYVNQNNEWGKFFTREDRPIYEAIDPEIRSLKNDTGDIKILNSYSLEATVKCINENIEFKNTVWMLPENKENSGLVRNINKLLRRINLRLDHSTSYSHDFVLGLIASVPGFARDYFMNCRIGSKSEYLAVLV